MSHKYSKTLIATLSMVIITGITVNLAQATEAKENKAKELALFSQAKISLTDAIKAAEQKTGGKAVEADIDDESSSVQFEIGILKDSKLHEVMVDGKTGDVVKVSQDDEANEGAENEKE
ncbi:PepSY domain-containing protein [Crenothrix sp.]|uniref:PepSY domain-containing protein n=1 Tax=Crenothrix sp. TaxID=3100433 RepID=UPI00374D5F11